MKRTSAIILYCLLTVIVTARDIHNPSEIFKIMDKSEVVYSIEELKELGNCPDRSDILNVNDFYRISDNGSFKVLPYDSLSTEGLANYELAEHYYSKKELDSARMMYEKVLETDPEFYKIWTYMGQIYGSIGFADLAEKQYLQTIEKNYIDYLAHWLLADIYLMQRNYDKALYQITIASILNRNNPRLKKLRDEIYEFKGLSTNDWCFYPQYRISSPDTGKVTIQYHEDWLIYAMCKALWNFEPGYKESMGIPTGQYTILEERECIANFIVMLMNSKKGKKKFKKDISLNTLKLAFENKMLDEYIMYEIFLPVYPETAYQLTPEFIDKIAKYVIEVRHSK